MKDIKSKLYNENSNLKAFNDIELNEIKQYKALKYSAGLDSDRTSTSPSKVVKFKYKGVKNNLK